MNYMGSKGKVVKDILPIILASRKENQWYVEPFVGGCNVIEHVDGKRVGGDINPTLVKMWQAVSKGWTPPDVVTEEDYKTIKKNPENYPDELVGYVAIALSFGAKWWGGYARRKDNSYDYAAGAYRGALRQFPKLIGVRFVCKSYREYEFKEPCLIYCDPPYQGTTKYATKDFDHEDFWQWCREMKAQGHTIFISEYNAPDDFKCVWEKEVINGFGGKANSNKGTEKLFTL